MIDHDRQLIGSPWVGGLDQGWYVPPTVVAGADDGAVELRP